MEILTGAAMREADRRTIQEVGVPARVLMESAGRGVAGAMEEHIDDLRSKSIVIVCGKGNNGGDGLVLLRTLASLDYDVSAVVLAPFEELPANAVDNLQSALKLELAVESVTTENEWTTLIDDLWHADVIVDAVFGTGLTRAAEGLPLTVIETINDLDAFRVSIDLPSGLSADTGAMIGTSVDADLTVALAAPKVCHFIPPACEQCGALEIAEIGIPPQLLTLDGDAPGLVTIDSLTGSWPGRDVSAHKGELGHVLIVAGSIGKTGAALLAAEAALRAGAGLVTVASAESAISMMAPRVPEVMWEPLPETTHGAISFAAVERVCELADSRSALALGPGLGVDEDTVRFVRSLIRECSLPTVIDADGLNALGDQRDLVRAAKQVALTPHPGEAGRLLGWPTATVQRDRLKAVRRLAREMKAPVVLKGYRSLIADPTAATVVNLTGNPGLATAGSGDVLTGVIGALLARGVSTKLALILGAHVHGLAGDLAADELGETSLIATDVIAKLPAAIQSLGAD